MNEINREEIRKILQKSASLPHPVMFPLGGIGRIGLNWTLYGYEGHWVLIDAGIGFPDKGEEGDFFIPDRFFIETIAPMVRALLVTHAHEDHIGAIHHLWPDHIRSPIFATPFASEIIKGRLRERNGLDKTEIRTFQPGQAIVIGPIRIDSASVSHSAPECVAFRLKMGGISILHTGDWKDDPSPIIGKGLDKERLKQWGDEGIDYFVGDSTNANRQSERTSERDVLEGLIDVMSRSEGMVVVGTFGSNLSRVASAVSAAAISGRYSVLMGRSVKTAEDVGRKLGLLENVPFFINSPSHLQGLKRREMCVVCTGTQGEENAALWRLARGDGGATSLQPGDTVIFSAREIPGREEAIAALKNALEQKGVKVLSCKSRSHNNYPLHVTGHACEAEIRDMHALIRPGMVIPVHGEASHCEAQATIAESLGIPSHVPEVGDILALPGHQHIHRIEHIIVCVKSESRTEEYMPNYYPRR
jgi:ribonuclease J